MTMITPSYLGETIEYSSLHACRSTLEDPSKVNLHFNWLSALVSMPHFPNPTSNTVERKGPVGFVSQKTLFLSNPVSVSVLLLHRTHALPPPVWVLRGNEGNKIIRQIRQEPRLDALPHHCF